MHRPVVLALVVSLVTSVVVGAGTLALANHQWPDVATGFPFHGDVAAFTDAGCATGFPDDTFRPTEGVDRQQAARFFRACGTRLANSDADSPTTIPAGLTGIQVRTDTITAGAVGDGGGFVLAIATVQLSSDDDDSADFPCTLLSGLTSPDVSGTEGAITMWRLAPVVDSLTVVSDSVTMTEMWPIAAGGTIQANVSVSKFGCDAVARAEADLSLLYVPFDGQGAGGG